jgi:hypothetical protein
VWDRNFVVSEHFLRDFEWICVIQYFWLCPSLKSKSFLIPLRNVVVEFEDSYSSYDSLIVIEVFNILAFNLSQTLFFNPKHGNVSQLEKFNSIFFETNWGGLSDSSCLFQCFCQLFWFSGLWTVLVI